MKAQSQQRNDCPVIPFQSRSKKWRHPMKVILGTPHNSMDGVRPHVAACGLTECSAPRELERLWAVGGDVAFYWIADATLHY